MYRSTFYNTLALCLLMMAAGPGRPQAAADAISIRAIAEVQVKASQPGREVTKLVPADRVVPGDQLIYTLEVRNTRLTTAPAPTVTFAVPAHMSYVADSAVGPGAKVCFSVDGGKSFDTPENLTIASKDGGIRPAVAGDYTHLRWQLKNNLKANSVAFLRFRALAK